MKDFSRQPTRGERVLAAVLTAALAIAVGSLAALFIFRGVIAGAAICGVITGIFAVMFYRAAFGNPRALHRAESRALAWVFLAFGGAGFIALFLFDGSVTHRLMVLSGSITLFSAGLVGVRGRGQDA